MCNFDEYAEINPELSRGQKEFIVCEIAVQIDRLSLKRLTMISQQPTRQDKIKYIETELYSRSTEEDVTHEQLIAIHEALVWSENEQVRTAIKDENTLSAWFNRVVFMTASVVALAIISSYWGVRICGSNRSPFCQSMHRIPDSIEAIFHEPSNKILPVNLP